MYQQVACLSWPRLPVPLCLHLPVCQSNVSLHSPLLFSTGFFFTAQQSNQNGRITSLGKLLLESCIGTVSSELPFLWVSGR